MHSWRMPGLLELWVPALTCPDTRVTDVPPILSDVGIMSGYVSFNSRHCSRNELARKLSLRRAKAALRNGLGVVGRALAFSRPAVPVSPARTKCVLMIQCKNRSPTHCLLPACPRVK